MTNLTSTWTSTRTQLRERRARRLEQRRLWADLASYTSESDRQELDAIIARGSADDADALQRIVDAQRQEQLQRTVGVQRAA